MSDLQGRIQRLKKGGHTSSTYRVSGDWCGTRRTQLSVRALDSFPGLRVHIRCLQYVAQKPKNEAMYIEHVQSSCRGSGGLGACSPRKILKFRPCESATEAVGEYLWQLKCKLRRFIVLSFLAEPLPSESAFVFEALPQNCLFNFGAADLSALCMQDMKQQCTASK